MDYFTPQLAANDINAYSVLTLAHLGDGVFELMVRTKLALKHSFTKDRMHTAVLQHVSATAQATAFERIRGFLNDDETAVFTRGRNAHVHVPKSATHAAYHTATGFEALFGWLWLSGRRERLNELFEIMTSDSSAD